MLKVVRRLVVLGVVFGISTNAVLAQQFFDPALDSSADTGVFGYGTDTTFQGATPDAPPENVDAGLGQTFSTGTQGWDDQNGANIPEADQGIMAIGSGFNRAACGFFGTSGFPSGGGAGKYTGASLPATATSLVDITVAE